MLFTLALGKKRDPGKEFSCNPNENLKTLRRGVAHKISLLPTFEWPAGVDFTEAPSTILALYG